MSLRDYNGRLRLLEHAFSKEGNVVLDTCSIHHVNPITEDGIGAFRDFYKSILRIIDNSPGKPYVTREIESEKDEGMRFLEHKTGGSGLREVREIQREVFRKSGRIEDYLTENVSHRELDIFLEIMRQIRMLDPSSRLVSKRRESDPNVKDNDLAIFSKSLAAAVYEPFRITTSDYDFVGIWKIARQIPELGKIMENLEVNHYSKKSGKIRSFR